MQMKFVLAKPEFEAERLFSYIFHVTRNFNDPMFQKLSLPITLEQYQKIKKGNFKNIKKILIEIIKSDAKKRKAVEKNIPKIQKKWMKIEKKLFEKIKEETRHALKGNFVCRLMPAYKSGGYNQKTNTIWIHSSEKKKSFWGVAHELLHVHCWKIWDRLIADYDEDEAWKFSEVFVELLLRDSAISFIIPKKERKIQFWGEVEEMAKKVLPLWKKRKNFDSFLLESFAKLKLKGKIKKTLLV